MSTDYFLYSPTHNLAVLVGSVGLGGIKPWPTEYGGREFLRWAMEESADDVRLINEHQLPDDVRWIIPEAALRPSDSE